MAAASEETNPGRCTAAQASGTRNRRRKMSGISPGESKLLSKVRTAASVSMIDSRNQAMGQWIWVSTQYAAEIISEPKNTRNTPTPLAVRTS